MEKKKRPARSIATGPRTSNQQRKPKHNPTKKLNATTLNTAHGHDEPTFETRSSQKRLHTITQKIATKYGTHYAHISFRDDRVAEIAFSSPGKFSDTALAELLIALSESVNTVIAEIGSAQ